jgi:phage repressor protein C with HTH and peptisase S24 domain
MVVSIDPATKARLLRRAVGSSSMWIPVYGASMGWTIPPGSTVHVVPSTQPRRGQLWAYCNDASTVVVHRYEYRADAGHVLRGDAARQSDPPVDDERIIGRVVAVRRGDRVPRVGSGFRIRGVLQRTRRSARAHRGAILRKLRRRH